MIGIYSIFDSFCIVLSSVPKIYLYFSRIEQQANLLWINSDSLYNVNEKWLSENFQKNQRQQVIIVEADNVLTTQSINKVNGNFIDRK